jgi:hypothetical protein
MRPNHAGGVLDCWGSLPVAGWFRLRSRGARLRHLPFVRSTRQPMPFIQPIVAILADIGLTGIASGISARNGTVLTSIGSS